MVQKFSSLKNQYLQSLADNLERRLSAHARDGKVLEALSQLTSPKCLLEFGLVVEHGRNDLNELIDTVCDWYVEKPTETTVSVSNVSSLPTAVSKSHLDDEMPKVFGLVRECYGKLEPIASLSASSLMCKLMLCVPVTSVECERAFSLQNRIKTKLRNRLGEERIDLLMQISMGPGPSVESFEYKAAVRQWKKQKQRRLAIGCTDRPNELRMRPTSLACLHLRACAC